MMSREAKAGSVETMRLREQALEEKLRRVHRYIELNPEIPITEVARHFGVPTTTLRARLRK